MKQSPAVIIRNYTLTPLVPVAATDTSLLYLQETRIRNYSYSCAGIDGLLELIVLKVMKAPAGVAVHEVILGNLTGHRTALTAKGR